MWITVDNLWIMHRSPAPRIFAAQMNTDPGTIYIKEYDYPLPPERIAHHPLTDRDASRLLHYRNGLITDETFRNLPHLLPPGATLVFNKTRVIEARVFFRKPTGGVIEIFCLEPADGPVGEAMVRTGESRWRCLIGGASKWKAGQVLEKELENGQNGTLTARYEGKEGDAFLIRFSWTPAEAPFGAVLAAAGTIPLPPYIKRTAEGADKDRYQTVFAEQPGSVAAPTASLHFTPRVLGGLETAGIRQAYLTLHVGAGTFKPVKSETVAGHSMHAEEFEIDRATLEQLKDAETIVAVGTTSLRTLESLYWMGVKLRQAPEASPRILDQWEAYALEEQACLPADSLQALLDYLDRNGHSTFQGRTSLLIAPGYRFRLPQALVTNFHQPQSTLLLLVSAFIGPDWKRVYDHALKSDYRFLSYGDSSLLWRRD